MDYILEDKYTSNISTGSNQELRIGLDKSGKNYCLTIYDWGEAQCEGRSINVSVKELLEVVVELSTEEYFEEHQDNDIEA